MRVWCGPLGYSRASDRAEAAGRQAGRAGQGRAGQSRAKNRPRQGEAAMGVDAGFAC